MYAINCLFQVKINSQNEDMLRQACELFMGKRKDEISEIALETMVSSEATMQSNFDSVFAFILYIVRSGAYLYYLNYHISSDIQPYRKLITGFFTCISERLTTCSISASDLP